MATLRKNKPFTIYMPPSLRNDIERIALEKDRPAYWIAVKLLQGSVRRLKRKGAAAT